MELRTSKYGTSHDVGQRAASPTPITLFALTAAIALTALGAISCSVATEEAAPAIGERWPAAATDVLVDSADPGDVGLAGFEVAVPSPAQPDSAVRAIDGSTTKLEFPADERADANPTGLTEQPAPADVLGTTEAGGATVTADAAPAGATQQQTTPADATQTETTQTETTQAEAAQAEDEAQPAQDITQPAESGPAVSGAGAGAAPPSDTNPGSTAPTTPTASGTAPAATDSLVVRGAGRAEGPADQAAPQDVPMSESAALACSTVELSLGDLDRGDRGQFGAEMTVAAGFASAAPEPQISAAASSLAAAAQTDDPVGIVSDFLTTCVALGYQV